MRDVGQGLAAPGSEPGDLTGEANGGLLKLGPGLPRSPQRGSHDAFLGEILVVHRGGDVACPRSSYTRQSGYPGTEMTGLFLC